MTSDIPNYVNSKKAHFQKIFRRLESEEELWQAASCIRLFFEFHSPISRVLGARWDQIDGDYWYPYFPDEKVYWYESRERIDPPAAALLEKNKERNEANFPESPFWFPRPSNPTMQCFSSVDLMWRKTLVACRMPYYPLREFARSYRDPYRPSYIIGFLRQYGEHFRKINNVAELSKRLIAQKRRFDFNVLAVEHMSPQIPKD